LPTKAFILVKGSADFLRGLFQELVVRAGMSRHFPYPLEARMSATIVLVHGAWFGGWCWRKVIPHLRSAGHEVFAPTLSGLGERAHLFTPDIDLDTHIEDIVGVLECEDLKDVVLSRVWQ
jgi:pimeloyl-ACP methyl ester carboxylesterase